MRAQIAVKLAVGELLERCQRRPPDEEAWREFIRRYDPSIRTNVAKTLQTRAAHERRPQLTSDQLDDLVQLVYMRLIAGHCRALKQFSGKHENSIYQYLAIISLNVVRDHFRGTNALKRPRV